MIPRFSKGHQRFAASACWSTIVAAPIAARTFLKLCVLWMNFLSTKLEWVRFSEKFPLASGISTQISAQI